MPEIYFTILANFTISHMQLTWIKENNINYQNRFCCWGEQDLKLVKWPINYEVAEDYREHDYGTEVEIQQPLKKFPDSNVSFLIRTGWCGRAFRHQNSLQYPWVDNWHVLAIIILI